MAEEDLFFEQAGEYSPFFEQSFSCINEKSVPGHVIGLNLLYRFADIFQEILAPEGIGSVEGGYAQFSRYFIDSVLHAVLYTDLRHGLTRREIYIHKILDELRNGTFWRDMAADFCLIEESKQGRFASLVLSQMEVGSSLRINRLQKPLRGCARIVVYQGIAATCPNGRETPLLPSVVDEYAIMRLTNRQHSHTL